MPMRIVMTILAFLICFTPAEASVPDDVRRSQDQIIGREELQQKQLQDQFREQSLPRESLETIPEKPGEGDEKRFYFKEIQLLGCTKLFPNEQQVLVAKYTNRLISVSEINEILRTITNAYISQGYITSRVYLPPQDLKTGVLKIKVLEGKIESLNVTRNKEKGHGAFAIPAGQGDILNIRDLEQGIDQISRLHTYDVNITMDAGKQDGGSIVNIDTTQKFPVTFNAGVDNYGSKSTGVGQADVQVTFENLFGLYESWGIDMRRDTEFHDKNHFTKSFGFQSSIPFGYTTVRYFASRFKYRSTVKGRAQDFQFSGTTQSHRVELDRLIHRDSDSKTNVMVAMATKDAHNYVDDIRLILGSQRLTLLSLNLSHLRRLWGGTFSGSVTHAWGIKGFKASKNRDMPRGGQRPQFNKLSADINYMKPFSFLGQEWSFSTRNSVQYARQKLFSSERISFGGAQTVRGFQQNGLAGDRGFYTRNELEVNLYAPKSGKFKTVAGRLTAFTGMDYGWIPKSKGDTSEHGVFKSVFVGLRLKDGITHTEMVLGKPLKKPSFLKNEGLVFHVKFGVSL